MNFLIGHLITSGICYLSCESYGYAAASKLKREGYVFDETKRLSISEKIFNNFRNIIGSLIPVFNVIAILGYVFLYESLYESTKERLLEEERIKKISNDEEDNNDIIKSKEKEEIKENDNYLEKQQMNKFYEFESAAKVKSKTRFDKK